MSKKSTKNELNCVSKSRMARNHCTFRLQMQPWPCKSAHKSSNSGESVLKKEIPDYTRAELLVRAGDLRNAEAQYLAAATLNGGNGASWAALAKMYEQQGRLNDAIHAWEQEVDILPAPYVELLSLGYDYLAAHRPEEALRAFDRSLRSMPAAGSDASFRANLAHGRAMAWKTLGNLQQAIASEEETVQLTPNRRDDWIELARLYDLEGRGEDARHARERAASLSGDVVPNPR